MRHYSKNYFYISPKPPLKSRFQEEQCIFLLLRALLPQFVTWPRRQPQQQQQWRRRRGCGIRLRPSQITGVISSKFRAPAIKINLACQQLTRRGTHGALATSNLRDAVLRAQISLRWAVFKRIAQCITHSAIIQLQTPIKQVLHITK